MKLPFKLPSFGKGKKGSDDDDDDDFDGDDDFGGGFDESDAEESDTEEEEGEAVPETDDGGEDEAGDDSGDDSGADYDDDDDYDYDEDDEESGGGFDLGGLVSRLKSDKRLMIMAGGGVLALLLLIGGGTWFLLSGDDGAGEAAKARKGAPDFQEIESGLKVVKRMPLKRGQKRLTRHAGPDDPDDPDIQDDPDSMLAPPQREGDAPRPIAGGSLNVLGGGAKGSDSGTVISWVRRSSFKRIPNAEPGVPLSTKPDKALFEPTSEGPLPVVGMDGRKPWKVYAAPFKAPANDPRIAIIVMGMGLSDAATEAVIRKLPSAVTLAFDPNIKDLAEWAVMAREAGHEILMTLPMEPEKFPIQDPGPLAMMSTLTPEENLRNLRLVMSRLTNYVGMITVMGSKFSAEEAHLKPVMEMINKRGLMLVDGGGNARSRISRIATEISLPRAVSDLSLDKTPSIAAIDGQLLKLEGIAREKAVAVAIADPNPSTLERLSIWIATLKAKNLALAPITAVADRQTLE